MHSKINEAIVTEFLQEPLVLPAPDYAGDIGLAWPLLEKMNRAGWFWRLDSRASKIIITLQKPLNPMDPQSKRKTFMIEAETGAGAICEGAMQVARDEAKTSNVIPLMLNSDGTKPPTGDAS